MRNLADTGIIWVFCENGPQGVREVSYELLGAAARLAKDAGTRVIAVALGAGAGAPGGTARARWNSLVFSCVVWVNNGISIPSSEYGICQSSPGPVPGAVPAV